MLEILKKHPLFRKALILAALTILLGGFFTVIGVRQIERTRESVAKLEMKDQMQDTFFAYEEIMTRSYGFLYAKEGELTESDFQRISSLSLDTFDVVYYAEGGVVKFGQGLVDEDYLSTIPESGIDGYYQTLIQGDIYVLEVDGVLYFHQGFIQDDELKSLMVHGLTLEQASIFEKETANAFYRAYLLDNEGNLYSGEDLVFSDYLRLDTSLMSIDFALVKEDNADYYSLYMALMSGLFFVLSGGLVMRYFYLETVKSKHYMVRLEEEARKDRVSGLPNAYQLYEDVDKLIEDDVPFYFALGHLNNIKHINDRFGHHLGEKLLSRMTDLLLGVLPSGFEIYHLGGDEYVVLGIDKKKNHFENTLKRLLEVYDEDILIDSFRMNLSMTMGVVHYPTSGQTVDQLIHNAHLSMRDLLQHSQSNIAFFEASKFLTQIEADDFDQFVKRIDLQSFELLMMPVVDTKTNTIAGFECLSRFYDHFHQLLPTDKMIESLERIGRIQELDELVFERMLMVKKKFELLFEEDVLFSVNASAISFNEDYVDHVIAMKEKASIEGIIIIELTESYRVEDYDYLIKLFEKLNRAGIEVGIDDFGSGYSSIGYIAKFPLYAIKVDKRFVRDYKDSLFNQTLLKTLISISDVLGCKLVAEGVDTYETLEFLKAHACPFYQGFLFHKGINEDGVVNLYKKHRRVEKM